MSWPLMVKRGRSRNTSGSESRMNAKISWKKHFDVTWEKLNLDLRACLYYKLVDEGKAKAPEEDEENMFANDAANSSKERRCS